MSFKLTIGRVAVAGIDLYTNEAIVSVDGKSGVVDNRWLAHVLPRIAASGVVDVAVKGKTLNKAKLERLEVELPSCSEQRHIAQVLDAVDSAIRSTERLISKLKQAKRGIRYELLTRGIDESGHLRDPLDPRLFKSSSVGRIPCTWSIQRIDQVGKTVTGSTPPSSIRGVWGGGLSFVTPGDIIDSSVATTERQVSARGKRFVRELPPGSVLVVCIGSTIGKSAVTSKHCATNQQINAIIPDPRFNPYFIHAAFTMREQHLLRLPGLQAVPIVNRSQFDSIEIALAPPEEQRLIGNYLRSADAVVQNEVRLLGKLHIFKQGLIDDLLTGRARVPVREAALR